MALNKTLLIIPLLLIRLSAQAQSIDVNSSKYLTVGEVSVTEVPAVSIKSSLPPAYLRDLNTYGSFTDFPNFNNPGDSNDPSNRAGKVIANGRELVALGEDIYKLVIKGKPTNTTSYTPISVVPKVAGAPVDPMDMENFRMPIKKTFRAIFKNLYRQVVVEYQYSVIFASGGSYDGRGAYITAAQIVPERVNTMFGYDFTATMKLGGIQNSGSKLSPVAGATLLMEYSVNTILKASTSVDTFYITGTGAFRRL